MTIDDALWARVVALLPKLRTLKEKKDKAKAKDLSKLSRAELADLVRELTA
jgi:hypothetical protein